MKVFGGSGPALTAIIGVLSQRTPIFISWSFPGKILAGADGHIVGDKDRCREYTEYIGLHYCNSQYIILYKAISI